MQETLVLLQLFTGIFYVTAFYPGIPFLTVPETRFNAPICKSIDMKQLHLFLWFFWSRDRLYILASEFYMMYF